jgi:hypothetical protein
MFLIEFIPTVTAESEAKQLLEINLQQRAIAVREVCHSDGRRVMLSHSNPMDPRPFETYLQQLICPLYGTKILYPFSHNLFRDAIYLNDLNINV